MYTAAQAEAGRGRSRIRGTTANKDAACAYGHTATLTGRNGEPDEVPPLSSLDPLMQKAIQDSGRIPPLAGAKFMKVWGARTTQELTNHIKQTAGPDEKTALNLTAYILQVNGAKLGPQAPTAAIAVEIRSVATGIAPQTTTVRAGSQF